MSEEMSKKEDSILEINEERDADGISKNFIEQLIDKMLLSIAEQSGGGSLSGIAEYQLDDGQIKIKTAYNSISQVEAGINSLEKLKNIYINRMRGRVTVLRDVNSFAKRR